MRAATVTNSGRSFAEFSISVTVTFVSRLKDSSFSPMTGNSIIPTKAAATTIPPLLLRGAGRKTANPAAKIKPSQTLRVKVE
jgi:hypothetical protein